MTTRASTSRWTPTSKPCPPPGRIGAPRRRHHGPNEDANEYVRRRGEQWALAAPGLDTFVVYDPISRGF